MGMGSLSGMNEDSQRFGRQARSGSWRARSFSQLRWSAALSRATSAEGIDPSWRMRPQPLSRTRMA